MFPLAAWTSSRTAGANGQSITIWSNFSRSWQTSQRSFWPAFFQTFCITFKSSGTPGDIGKSLGSAILVSALFISLMKIRGMYRPAELRLLRNQIHAVCVAWISVFLLLAGTVFALKIGSEFSRGTSMLFAVFGLIALIVHRSVLKDLLTKGLAGRRFSGRNIVLITDHSQMDDASLLTLNLTDLGFCVEGHFIFPPESADSHRREESSRR